MHLHLQASNIVYDSEFVCCLDVYLMLHYLDYAHDRDHDRNCDRDLNRYRDHDRDHDYNRDSDSHTRSYPASHFVMNSRYEAGAVLSQFGKMA